MLLLRLSARFVAAALLASGAEALAQLPPPPLAAEAQPVDPLTLADADFVRNRATTRWDDMFVTRIDFVEAGARWRLWRIDNRVRQDGPLWVVPHDDEDAAFDAGLTALATWGGTMIAVDSGATREQRDVGGRDPNRSFRDSAPLYAGAVLESLRVRPRVIVALHSNDAGFDERQSYCPSPARGGSGVISIGFCDDRYHPVPARARTWPFDDDDSLAILPFRLRGGDGWCARPLMAAGFNLVFERVVVSDGSLSNYAAQHGLAYVNFETRNPGAGRSLAEARARLTEMVDRAMTACGVDLVTPLATPR